MSVTEAVSPWEIGFLGACVTCLALFPLRQHLDRKRIMDVPNARSSHNRPTPRGGGLVIVAVTLGGLLLVQWLAPFAARPPFLAYASGAIIVSAVSWLDDVRSLPGWVRFTAHGMAAALAILAYGYWPVISLPIFGEVRLDGIGALLAFAWIVGLSNAYNFMDGIDGMAGGLAVVAGLGWAGLGWAGGERFLCVLGALLAGSSLGFLWHNWSPARIFMGDVGSVFLGYTFAVSPLLLRSPAGWSESWPGALLAGVLMVWPFVLDAGLTFLGRLWRRENVFAAHRSHLYQRMAAAGRAHGAVAILYMALALMGAALAFHVADGAASADRWVVGLFLLSTGAWLALSRQEFRLPSGILASRR